MHYNIISGVIKSKYFKGTLNGKYNVLYKHVRRSCVSTLLKCKWFRYLPRYCSSVPILMSYTESNDKSKKICIVRHGVYYNVEKKNRSTT